MPAAVQLCVHFTWAILFPSSRTSETPPQSGSGRKKQIKSKAAIRNCTHSFAQRVQLFYRKTSNGRSRTQSLRSLGVPKGVFSTVENTPFDMRVV